MEELIKAYAPVLCLHPEESYTPMPVEAMIENAVLKRRVSKKSDPIIIEAPTMIDLFQGVDPDLYLTYKPGVSLVLLQNKYPNIVYARLAVNGKFLILQFYFFYLFNDWVNKHEGDWEVVQIAWAAKEVDTVLLQHIPPSFVTFSQHGYGVTRPWSRVEVRSGSHPIVYVSQGSHANFFAAGTYYVGIGFERTGTREVEYTIEVIPTDLSPSEEIRSKWGWLFFAGHWGRVVCSCLSLYQSGPVGPKFKLMWDQPLYWAEGKVADNARFAWIGRMLSRLWFPREHLESVHNIDKRR